MLIFQIFIKLLYERALKEQQGEGGEEGFGAAWAYGGEKKWWSTLGSFNIMEESCAYKWVQH